MSSGDVTMLLMQWGDGDQSALEHLTPKIYSELHRLAGSYLRKERAEHTLQATALVNEAFLKLVDQSRVEWRNRAHFFGIAAQAMRRILIDRARKKQAVRHGGGLDRTALDDIEIPERAGDEVLLRVNDALEA
ncbi:MAG: RNA polymerase subunit sigma-70, partial [Bryobacterales bacterium]|nr:RNA polymerase subunit sigma-70 [Bryobacterales bacterium]